MGSVRKRLRRMNMWRRMLLRSLVMVDFEEER
jgi:hypothetical protein